jgi:probable HAF family extracellular repeat protein
MKNFIRTTALFVAFMTAVPLLPAQTYSIPWYRIGPAGAGGGGGYSLSGSVGQWDAANMSGGNFSLSGGFWVFSPTQVTEPIQYTLIDLGTLGGDGIDPYPGSEATAINNAGEIVGYAYTVGNTAYRATYWSNSTSIPLDLGTLGGVSSDAWGINDLGQIVGDAYLPGGEFEAAVWAKGSSRALDLGNIGGGSTAVGVNNSGQIVGTAYTAGNAMPRAVLWATTNSQPLDLGTLGGAGGDASSINDLGQIVGDGNPAGGSGSYWVHAAFWPNAGSRAVDLGTLGYLATWCSAINQSGQIVGGGIPASNTYQAAFWTNRSSGGLPLATPGSPQSFALGINASGQIVGWAGDSTVYHAVLWTNSTAPALDLNTVVPANSGWTLLWANAINDSGEIVGVGSINGHERAFALRPLQPDAPATATFLLRIVATVRSGNDLQLSFTSQAGHTFNVLATADLNTGTWVTLLTGIPGTGGTVAVTIPNAFTQPRQFYRIQQAQ